MRRLVGTVALGMLLVACAAPVLAHGVADRDARLLESIDGPAIAPLMYLGAKHMVTSLFTVGHSVTLLAGALGGLRVNPYLIDAVIGLSVVYKAFENMGGFRRLGWQLDARIAVLVFGLFHGFGLATKLQDLALSPNGLVTNIVSFNVGVEMGQVLALTIVMLALAAWRTRPSFVHGAFATNAAIMTGGFLLMGYQLTGYVVAP